MDLMKQYGISVPKGKVVETAAEAEVVAAEMLHGVGGSFCGSHIHFRMRQRPYTAKLSDMSVLEAMR